MLTCFVIFVIPYLAQWIMDLRFWVWDIITM